MRLRVVTREPLIMSRRLSRLQQQHLRLCLFTVKHFKSNYRWSRSPPRWSAPAHSGIYYQLNSSAHTRTATNIRKGKLSEPEPASRPTSGGTPSLGV